MAVSAVVEPQQVAAAAKAEAVEFALAPANVGPADEQGEAAREADDEVAAWLRERSATTYLASQNASAAAVLPAKTNQYM